jgi:hypothetical protein
MNFNINLYKKLLKKECWYKDCEIYNKYYKKPLSWIISPSQEKKVT